jgi:hypothetical protein
MDACDSLGRITLISQFRSLLFAKSSLLILLGNLQKVTAAQWTFGWRTAAKTAEIAKFPVNFPVSRESPLETGSYLTAHTTIQSYQTSEIVVVQKSAGSAGIFALVGAASRSLRALALSRADFWSPVSALKNFVPDARISSGKGTNRAVSLITAEGDRAHRIVGSIPREGRGTAQRQCRAANALRLLP